MRSDIDDPKAIYLIPAPLKLKISQDLEQFHRVFDVFWGLSEIYFSPPERSLKTACVTFPPGGKSHMIISKEFWDSLNDDEKLFVIIHECLHVMLDHGMRNAQNVPGATPKLINIAQDITINEMIVDMFGFARGLMRDWQKYCWIETCFADPSTIERNQVFEYYLKKLIENPPPPEMDTLDEHDDTGGYADGDPDPLAQKLGEYLSWDELQALIKSMGKEDGRGIGLSPYQVILENRTPTKIDFKLLIKKLKRSAKAREHKEADSWAREPRRFGGVSKMILPGRIETKPHKQKLITALFFDVSGSCMPYLNTFNSVRLAFEEDKKLFDVRSFAFDTRVFEVLPGQQLGIGGGTSFNIIEQKCQEIVQEDGRYPDCVVIVTDGAGNRVAPQHPNRWVWMLTPGATRTYIDSRSAAWPIKRVTF
jgi:predicted metal-dependent peptidase